jgi:hypothetical protein
MSPPVSPKQARRMSVNDVKAKLKTVVALAMELGCSKRAFADGRRSEWEQWKPLPRVGVP